METSASISQYADHNPYPVGQILRLKAALNNSTPGDYSELLVRVKRQNRPWTLSCGMVVENLEDVSDSDDDRGLQQGQGLGNDREAFLKIFDRRYAQQLRDDNGIEEWSNLIEQEFLDGIRSGKMDDFLRKLRSDKQFQQDTEDDWDAAENEAFLWDEVSKCFKSEVAAYSVLTKYQGELIPRLLAEIALDISPPDPALGAQQQELSRVKGILLEYLPGFSLSSITQRAPQAAWQNIVDQAIKIVHVLGDNNILNTDVRPDNFVVVPKRRIAQVMDEENSAEYRVFMIDFGQCRLRREDESDAEWGRAKWIQDEEGAVGAVMRMMLGKIGFELDYRPSWRYLEWAPGEDD
ncbi:hypothetical protein BGZ61DRAFT_462559 [Ilyonectria robusta]|uniref:uncharacterized protein n=1 Tax=Ilyonectria robusta TaxID=1079257 RepID=UPI001E8DBAF2|nr:uncharacterized protein BGZ61DRAFT_462559 [Ilyonectria robusta]KAH8663736.1 hypothetical protein BGZ61DRAFT_462559 [Ilyonectria robusta]